jgi:hypothetical protein
MRRTNRLLYRRFPAVLLAAAGVDLQISHEPMRLVGKVERAKLISLQYEWGDVCVGDDAKRADQTENL